MEAPLKRKYLPPAHKGRFKSKSSNSGKGGKPLMRANKSWIARPAHAEWPRHVGGTWWGGKDKTRHRGK